MAAKPRTKEAGPAKAQAPGLVAVAKKTPVLPPVAAQVLDVSPVTVQGKKTPDPAPAPPQLLVAAAAASPPAASPLFAQPSAPILPRGPDDIVHNVAVRQLKDDEEQPPVEQESPELKTLEAIAQARLEGKSLDAEIKAATARTLAGGEDLDRLTWHFYRRHQTKKLVEWLSADDRADRFLLRLYKRGDLTATEALIMKKLSNGKVKELAEELLQGLRDGYPEMNHEEALVNVDLGAHITTATQTLMEKTTPQGREIVRKLVFTARQRVKHAK